MAEKRRGRATWGTGRRAGSKVGVRVAPFVAFLGPRLLSLPGEAIFVALAALVLKVLVQNALQPLYPAAVVLVFVAPLAQELLRFLDSALIGANYASAAGARRALAEAVARRDSMVAERHWAHAESLETIVRAFMEDPGASPFEPLASGGTGSGQATTSGNRRRGVCGVTRYRLPEFPPELSGHL
jgi:hypothetical protein